MSISVISVVVGGPIVVGEVIGILSILVGGSSVLRELLKTKSSNGTVFLFPVTLLKLRWTELAV